MKKFVFLVWIFFVSFSLFSQDKSLVHFLKKSLRSTKKAIKAEKDYEQARLLYEIEQALWYPSISFLSPQLFFSTKTT